MTSAVPDQLRAAYDIVGDGWAHGPERIYDRLAEHLVAHAGTALADRLALDVGAGHGAATRALQARGARVVAADLSSAMLRADAQSRPPAVVADLNLLPLRDAAVDLAVASFVVSHLEDPAGGLREMARVVRRGGVLLASAFAVEEQPHPAKQVVEDVAAGFGYRRPSWYDEFKGRLEREVATASRLRDVATGAGLDASTATEATVDLGRLTAAELVAWRLGTPSMAQFVAGLDRVAGDRLVATAKQALGPQSPPVLPRVLLLRAVAP